MTPDPRQLLAERRRRLHHELDRAGVFAAPPSPRARLLTSVSDLALYIALWWRP